MYAVLKSFGLKGLNGFPVEVEADISGGMPALSIVGLPDSAVRESGDRVHAALKNLGFKWPDRRITINLAPADVRKTGPVYDLPLLLAVLTELFLRNTQFGRNLFLVGGNISVADNLGIKARNYIWSAYIFQGLFAAIGGVVMMTRQFSASGNLALQGPMEVIPMVIVGGTSMAGGRGGALKTVGGVVLLKIIYNAMTMFSIPAPLQPFVKGLILLVVIVSDKYMERRHEKV